MIGQSTIQNIILVPAQSHVMTTIDRVIITDLDQAASAQKVLIIEAIEDHCRDLKRRRKGASRKSENP